MFAKVFLSHPRSVDESYLEHSVFAARFAGRLLVAASAAAIHAIIPCLFEKTASRMIAQMHGDLSGRGDCIVNRGGSA